MAALGKIFVLIISFIVIFVIFLFSVAIIGISFHDENDIFYEYECDEMERNAKGDYERLIGRTHRDKKQEEN